MTNRAAYKQWLKRNLAVRPLESAKQWLALNYSIEVSIREAAQIAGYSPSHFTRAFAAAYGETPRAFVARVRIERAMRLLASAKTSVQEVAAEVGFVSVPTFCNRFKAMTGRTPTEFQSAARAESISRNQPVNTVVPACIVRAYRGGNNSKPE